MTKWFNDEVAQRVHAHTAKLLEGVIAELCPGYELSHMGVNRNDTTEEVVLKLHLNPIGSVRVVSDRIGGVPHILKVKHEKTDSVG